MSVPASSRQQTRTTSNEATAYGLLLMVCAGHFLNDGIQSVIPAALPVLREAHALTFTQVGLITLVIQFTSSLLQPLVGMATDRRPTRYALAAAMAFTLLGLIALAYADSFSCMLLAVALIGCGSAVFHPEAVRIAHLAGGGRKGLAQSVFQVGGNAGMALGPLAAAFVVIPYGQSSIAWFAAAAALAVLLMLRVGTLGSQRRSSQQKNEFPVDANFKVVGSPVFVLSLLFVLMFSKQVYIACLQNYLTFYLIDEFNLSMTLAQYVLFGFLIMSAVGTIAGGPLTDRFAAEASFFFPFWAQPPLRLEYPGADFTVSSHLHWRLPSSCRRLFPPF